MNFTRALFKILLINSSHQSGLWIVHGLSWRWSMVIINKVEILIVLTTLDWQASSQCRYLWARKVAHVPPPGWSNLTISVSFIVLLRQVILQVILPPPAPLTGGNLFDEILITALLKYSQLSRKLSLKIIFTELWRTFLAF